MKFADNLRSMRKSRGWTQVDLGIKTGINPKTLSSYEGGRTEPSLGEVVKLCDAFGCSISHLTGTKERDPGDISVEDIMFKLRTLDLETLAKVRDYADHLAYVNVELIKMQEERDELKKRLAEYDKKIKEFKED